MDDQDIFVGLCFSLALNLFKLYYLSSKQLGFEGIFHHACIKDLPCLLSILLAQLFQANILPCLLSTSAC